MRARQILLVEGIADTSFYDAFCRESGIKEVGIVPPRSLGAKADGKPNAIYILDSLLDQIADADASLKRLGLVIDADYEEHQGLGCVGTLAKIREKLAAHGFNREKRIHGAGFLFDHPDGLAPVGAWIMPDNRNEGMLEDFIKAAIVGEEQAELHNLACRTVGSLKTPLFKPFHRSKAEVSTWLAWQKMPGARLESAVGNKLIELSSANCKALAEWLRMVFPGP